MGASVTPPNAGSSHAPVKRRIATHGVHSARACASDARERHIWRQMDAQNTPAIAVDRLVKLYKSVAAVDGISFRLAPGSITGLLGGNGAGKTTTIAMIMGLVQPTSGTVTRAGRANAASSATACCTG